MHTTIDAIKLNSLDLKLKVESDRLTIENPLNVEAYWDNQTLKKAFERKYHKMIYVLADHKKEEGKECFWYNEAYQLDGFGFKRFSKLVGEEKLKVDIRIGHYPDGRLHDHGTGFRILPKYLPQCFENINQIL